MKETFYHMPELVMMVGLPGSGKSTYAEKLKKEGVIIHSSDAIREELGDVNDQSNNEEVFKILHKRIKDDLRDGKSVAYDATNLNRKRRVAFLRELQNIPCEKVCVLIATPFKECLLQNLERERTVPREVLDRMYKSFQMPSTYEGFDEVIVHYPKKNWKEYYGDIYDFIFSLVNFNQSNSHHTLTLGEHMMKASDYILIHKGEQKNNLYYAALSHDIGKPFTKSFLNSKGEVDTEAHYYSHHNCGSYNSLFFEYPEYVDKKYVALLIELHMKPHMEWKQSEKAKDKYRRLFGDKVIEDVMMIHWADINAK